MITSLIYLLIYLLVIGIVIWLALFIVQQLPLASPFGQVARTIIVVVGCLILILLLLNFVGVETGRPLFR